MDIFRIHINFTGKTAHSTVMPDGVFPGRAPLFATSVHGTSTNVLQWFIDISCLDFVRKNEAGMKRSDSFIPDFCSLQTTFILVLVSLLLAFVLSLADFSEHFGFWPDFGLRSFFIIWVVLLSGATLCILHSRLVRLSPAWGGIATFTVVQAIAVMATAIAREPFTQFGYSELASGDPVSFELRVLGVSSLVTAAWLRYQYIQSCWRLQSRAEVLTRLDALQARMHPHFLFNSLNAVAGLIREDPPAAEALLLDMAEVYRAILRKDVRNSNSPANTSISSSAGWVHGWKSAGIWKPSRWTP